MNFLIFVLILDIQDIILTLSISKSQVLKHIEFSSLAEKERISEDQVDQYIVTQLMTIINYNLSFIATLSCRRQKLCL